ncbi:hypothetical protein ACFFLZ_14405 [Photobacterium aphoticum]|uniref:Uncharacterized protein n=1 Tax=Photobacterium aphoticum TaxID=754436 RepID=A0A0J1GLA9_9GAMM|nr:hypothetical protein [Photobacterium aphoticum]KLV00498.1 hypothetical protein ABT58_12665 [Photobacterium aphoticum]PSU59851.1 hypothetical protein C9I90_02500 [Photobacterium aphoticum]GHA41811.1 hypothetical protein GCM10007086_14200 [Photobacterium aphoticum]
MSLTVFSKRFKKELDYFQLERLFEIEVKHTEISFRDFVKIDAECPCCHAADGHYVKEKLNGDGRAISQPCFRFKKHYDFCIYNSVKSELNESYISFAMPKEGSDTTKRISHLVCAAIENNFFSQEDIRNMREWFSGEKFYEIGEVNINPHIINLAKVAIRRRNHGEKYYLPYNLNENNLSIEAYESMHFRYKIFEGKSKFIHAIDSKACQNKVISSNGHERVLINNLNKLYDIDLKVRSLSSSIIMAEKWPRISKCRVNERESINAFSSLILYINNWDLHKSFKLYFDLKSIEQVTNNNLGSLIGINPVSNFRYLSCLSIINSITVDFDVEEAFEKEKAYLIREKEEQEAAKRIQNDNNDIDLIF